MKYTKGVRKVIQLPPLSQWVVAVNAEEPLNQKIVAQLFDNKDDAILDALAPSIYEALKDLYEVVNNLDIDNMPADLAVALTHALATILAVEVK
jgi:hypothetical protein